MCKSMLAEHQGTEREPYTSHAYDHHPTPDRPMVRYGQFRCPPDVTSEWVRDDGLDNLESVV